MSAGDNLQPKQFQRRSKKIEEGDTIRSKNSGHLYRVNSVMTPASGGHLKSNRVYDVTHVDSGLVNAFTGDEIELHQKGPKT